jgi:hypothetical protein
LARMLSILWTKLFHLWKMRNDAIHGHNIPSQQQAWQQKLRIEMEMLHTLCNTVLACDTNVFVGDTLAEWSQFLDTSTATSL